jgi:hypothetical protein
MYTPKKTSLEGSPRFSLKKTSESKKGSRSFFEWSPEYSEGCVGFLVDDLKISPAIV